MLTRADAVNPQLLNQLTSQVKSGRFNKHYALPFSNDSFDEEFLIKFLLQSLRKKRSQHTRTIPSLIALKNLLEKNEKLTKKETFEDTINKILKNQDPKVFDNIINNISYLIAKRSSENFYDTTLRNDKEFFSFLEWLQDRLLFIKIINTQSYKNILEQLEAFKKESEISFYDKAFRYFNAGNTGLGFGSFFLSWGPMALMGLLGFLGCAVPPIGITLITIGFGIIGVGIGGTLIYKLLKNYRKEDQTLTHHVQDSVQAIHDLARKEAALCKQHYCLNYKNLLYLTKVNNREPKKLDNCIDQIDITTPLKNESAQVDIGWRVAMSFFGTLGSVWGSASLICGLIGIGLLSSTAFTPAGLLVVGVAIIVGGAIAYKTLSYDRKTNKCGNKLKSINDQSTEIHKSIINEQREISHLAAEKEALKLQILTEQPENIIKLNEEFEEVEKINLPVAVKNIHEQKAIANKSKYFSNGLTLFSKLGIVKPHIDEPSFEITCKA